jgi:hypothetical protein
MVRVWTQMEIRGMDVLKLRRPPLHQTLLMALPRRLRVLGNRLLVRNLVRFSVVIRTT